MSVMRSMFRFHQSRCLLIAMSMALSGHLSAQAPDTGEDIRPPKELIAVPRTLVETLQDRKSTIALYSSIGGGVFFLLVVLFLWRRHYLSRQINSSARIALLALVELESDQEGIGAEAFAYLASKVVRQYIAERFGLAAPRRTTEEFLRDLAKEDSSSLIGESDHLRAFLKSCDLAKFAGSNLDSTQRGELIHAARGFIHSTSKAATP